MFDFAAIPHDWHRRNAIVEYEGYYASVFYSHFPALGLDIRVAFRRETPSLCGFGVRGAGGKAGAF